MSNTLRGALIEQLRRFDDEAFVALANRGLLRRAQKDLEKQAAMVVEESAEAVTMAFVEHRIRFDVRGPAHAQCTCPASGVCQHILAAALTLQREAAAPVTEVVEDNAATDPLTELQAALLRLTTAELTRHAGKPGYRWAWQFVQDLDPAQGLAIGGERHLLLSFSHPRIAFRYMGGGLDSLIADAELSQLEKYRVAAVLAFQRVHGQEIAPPETTRPRNASLDLGADHALAEPAALAQDDSRTRLRESAQQLFAESVSLGLSHLSKGIQDRYVTLAVWAQGAEYHRLAMLLRRLADHVELLLDRAGGADEHRLFDELSLAHALVSALDDAHSHGLAPAHLVGRARNRYEETGALELLGLGAHSWRSASGYVGLSLLFWSPAQQAFLSCTDARPEGQRGFDPIARYKAAGPWSGLGAPAQTVGRALALQGAQLSAAGRLSAADSTAATLLPALTAEAFRSKLQTVERWADVMRQCEQQNASVLTEPQPMKDWVVLRPARYGKPSFDENRQLLSWPLFDHDGARLDAELAFGPHTRHAIERIEQWRDQEPAAGTLMVGRLQPTDAGLTVWPLSLVRASAAPDVGPVDSLHFDPAPEKGLAQRWMGKLRQTVLGGSHTDDAPEAVTAVRTPPALRELRHELCRWAERGVTVEQTAALHASLQGRYTRLADAGLQAFRALQPAAGGAGADLLRTRYLALQYERLFDGPPGEAP